MSRHHREWSLDCKVYIGNLAEGASKVDIENSFGKYGPLRNVWVARNPPGFAFVEFEDTRDAEDAVRGLDGTRIAGARVRAEMSHGRTRRGGYHGGGGRRSGRGDSYASRNGRSHGRGNRSRSRSRSRSRTPRRSKYSRSRSRSKSRSRTPRRSVSRSATPVHRRGPAIPKSPISPRHSPRGARTPPSRSRSRTPPARERH